MGNEDERTAAALVEVDQRRLNYAQNLFQQLGFSRTDAKIRARIAYSVKLSWSTMPLTSNQTKRLKEMQFVYEILTQHSKSSNQPSPSSVTLSRRKEESCQGQLTNCRTNKLIHLLDESRKSD